MRLADQVGRKGVRDRDVWRGGDWFAGVASFRMRASEYGPNFAYQGWEYAAAAHRLQYLLDEV